MISEHQEEAAALYALHLLEGAELAQFEAELAHNSDLRRLVGELHATTAHCSLLAPSAAPSDALRARVLASVARHPAMPPGQVLPFRWLPWAGWAAAAVFALLALVFFQAREQLDLEAQTLQLAADASRLGAQEETQLLEAERILSQQQIKNLQLAESRAAAAEVRVTALEQQTDVAALKIDTLVSLLGNTPQARAIAVWNPATQEGVLDVSRLPALAANQDYQLWVVDPQYPIPVDGGVFQVDPGSGGKHFLFKPHQLVNTAAKFAVSLERKGGVPKAEGPMVLLSE